MINIELVPVKYITGTYKYDSKYPTAEDLLWDIVTIGKKTINTDSIDWVEEEKRDKLVSILEKAGFIKNNNNKIIILKTYWDERSNE